ncbi:DUF881 domain-containing protein [Allorhizocola rhizosphaerae]|uniref:DUF881 domain-containing protein n=1 Tax=Allorhizocola rhizosphaerae TaxID=1872709 RepID=UPI000E3C1FB5|nr:DUF881 domain-containing protein [Allorhizocola rhizosphaerae]
MTDEQKPGQIPIPPATPASGDAPVPGGEPVSGAASGSRDASASGGEPVSREAPLAQPDPDGLEESAPVAQDESEPVAPQAADEARRKQVSGAGALIGVLLALLGFTFVVQIRSNAGDAAYASAREGDLLQIMSDLDAYERRLNQDITSLEQTRRELQSGAAGRDAALAEAKARADALGILAGTLKARGPGVMLRFVDETGKIKAGTLLNAVQELRGAGAEALQIDGSGGSVRIIASTSFVDDSAGGVRVDGRRLTGPYTIRAVGDPATLKPAMEIAGGVVAAARTDGGNVIVNQMDVVEINETRSVPELEYARPVT